MADRRTGQIDLHVSPAEAAAWRAKAEAAGVPLSDLLRQAMARTRTWTSAAAERDRSRQVVRIGKNLNQIARWANTHASAIHNIRLYLRGGIKLCHSLLRLATFLCQPDCQPFLMLSAVF